MVVDYCELSTGLGGLGFLGKGLGWITRVCLVRGGDVSGNKRNYG